MVDINKLISKHYLKSDVILEMIQKQLLHRRGLILLEEETQGVVDIEAAAEARRDIVLRLPIFRLSEKMWGKEGTEDRAIIENIMSKIIAKGNTLKDKIRLLSNFIQSPPQTDDISEILSHIVFLDT